LGGLHCPGFGIVLIGKLVDTPKPKETQMNKILVSYAAFEATAQKLGPVVKYNDNVFYIKAGKAGRVELNINNGTYIVGSYSKYLNEITAAVQAAGFKLLKTSSTRTTFEFKTLEHIVDVFNAAVSAVPSTKPVNRIKAAEKLAGIKTSVKKTKTVDLVNTIEKSAEENARVKEKNLATMKAVSAKLDKKKVYQPGQVSSEKESEEKISKEEMKRRKAEIDSFTNYEINELPSFRSPEKLTRDEVRYLV